MKKYLIIVIAIILIFAIGITVSVIKNNKTEDKKEPLKKVSVSEVTRSVFYAPQYVAIAKGFMEEEGLEVEITTGQGADKVMTAVLSNQCDIGFAGPEASIYVYNEGKEDYCQVFAQLTQRDGAFLVSREKTNNFSWNDLKGKTVIPGRKGGVPYMTFEYVLKQQGLIPGKDVILDDSIQFDLMAGAFAAGNADYVVLFEPTASMTQKANAGYVVKSIGEDAGEIPYTAYFAKKSYIENNSNIIQSFTNAIDKAEKWVDNHTMKEVAEAIVGFFPDTDIETLTAALQSYKNINAWKTEPSMTEESFDRLQTVIETAGELQKKAPFDKIVNNSFAKNVNK